MWPESDETNKKLRTGLTTGCCATACCVAAAHHLFSQTTTDTVNVTLPKGLIVDLSIIQYHFLSPLSTRADVTKDAGDDPDVTHGATIFVELTLTPQSGIVFKAAQGVGIVTREGLALAVGEPAINPVPRQMMTEHLQFMAAEHDYQGGFEVAVGVENGEEIALKTMNGRLGIVGGLSILGVSGIVRPFSCSAYIASIFQGLDVATTNGHTHIAASTGNRSEDAIKAYYQLPDIALIEMGDFVGAVIKHLKKVPVSKLSICGGFGKISKLAMGKWNLHSKVSAIDLPFLAELAQQQGASPELMTLMVNSNTSIEALNHCYTHKIDLATAVCQAAFTQVRSKIPAHTELEIWVINRQGDLIGFADHN
ncbi:cobalamin biosynthesis protein CbiD [Moritella sp. PE36]|uniref:cobalt-precorrin-5B (C(1))-methyltransferase n=1 Tax=Moritella sp. PE36 TaxID=58051 RepID=UPI00015698B5|nr:cobalt-precorrin-5B (C(1))-methyltransferase [Moritella sp. PE36]EDM66068.1 cobalamin biosynthesis protein CbiD [Moritella sp. PE36]